MPAPLRVLIVEDSKDDAELLVRHLTRAGYSLIHERVDSAPAFHAALERGPWDVVLSDNSLPHFNGTAALKTVREDFPDVPFIFVSGTLGEDAAAEAMRAGAQDYLVKGKLQRLVPTIERELRDAESRRERFRVEQALRASEATYRSLVEQAPYGICRSTAEGRVLAANPALVRMLGYGTEQELLALRMGDDVYVNPAERETLVGEILSAGQLSAEATWRRKDGARIAVRQTSRVVTDPETGTTYFDTIVEDISERRLLETQLHQAQKMEAIGRLAGGLAHDFNNLLTAILGSANLMLESLPDAAAEREEAHEIHNAAIRAAELTRQLLAFSRQQVLAPKVIDANEIVTGIHRLLGRLIGEDVELQTIPSPEPVPVRADPGQLEQVIVNLAVNARDAMPGGGKLIIETTTTEIGAEYLRRHAVAPAPGPWVMIAVTDTGIGMDTETQARIFEPFFTTKSAEQGTGLGLATVYGIIKQSGGFIWVYSEVGHGTTFKVYLPRVSDAIEPSRPIVAPAVAPRGTETILLVEDQTEVRRFARKVLEGRGYAVLAAASGPDALVLAERHTGPIHLLVTDVIMPGMSGRELSLLLASMRPDLQLLFLSGYTGNSVLRRGMLDPNIAFLQKPFTAEGLCCKVREVLDSPGGQTRIA